MPLLSAVLLAMSAPAAQGPIADLPFERIGNRIYLKGNLNGKPVNAILDTGAGSTVADMALGIASGAQKQQELTAGGGGSQQIQAWIVSGLNLKLEGTSLVHPIAVILPLESLTVMEGRPLQTILGYDFINRYRIEIDYATSHVRFFPPSIDAIPEGATVLPVEFVRNVPQVHGKISLPGLPSRDVTMMLDTGATMSFVVTGRLSEAMKLDEKFGDIPDLVLGGGVGGETKGRRLRMSTASIGDQNFEKPVTTIDTTGGGATGKGATYDVLVGGELLRRFTVTLDYAHKRIFLKPNGAKSEPFIGDRTGLALKAILEGGYSIFQVVPGSPAAEAGLTAGDIIVQIDGKVPPSLDEARNWLRNATKPVTIRFKRGGGEKEAVLTPRETIP